MSKPHFKWLCFKTSPFDCKKRSNFNLLKARFYAALVSFRCRFQLRGHTHSAWVGARFSPPSSPFIETNFSVCGQNARQVELNAYKYYRTKKCASSIYFRLYASFTLSQLGIKGSYRTGRMLGKTRCVL